jgi:hypothetical protein
MSGPIVDDMWKDLLGPIVAILAVVIVGASYKLGWLGELPTAIILASVLSGVVFIFPFFLVEAIIQRSADKAAYLAVGLGTTSIFMTAVLMQVFPGDEVAKLVFRGDVREQSFAAPPDGALRLVVRTDTLGTKKDRLDYKLILSAGSASARVEGALVRPTTQSRGNPGMSQGKGKANGPHGAESKLVSLPSKAGEVRVKLIGVDAQKGGLYVDVFRSRCPRTPLLVAQAALFLLALIVRRRIGHVAERVYLLHIAVTGLALAITLPGALTPESPVMPLFGSIVVALIAGGLGGEVLSWIALTGIKKRVV